MAETTMKTTNPTAPGMSTTEGKFTLAAQLVGFLLATFGAILTQYAETHPGNVWAGVGTSALGVALMAATHFGYTKGRAIVKNQMLQQAIDWAAPAAAAALAKALEKQLAPIVVGDVEEAPPPLPVKPPAVAPLETKPSLPR